MPKIGTKILFAGRRSLRSIVDMEQPTLNRTCLDHGSFATASGCCPACALEVAYGSDVVRSVGAIMSGSLEALAARLK